MLDAAEEMLLSASFDQITVAEIAARAGVTIGAFYARFADKESLLCHLEERMGDDFIAMAAEDTKTLAKDTLDAMVLRHHRRLIGLYRKHRAITRALVLRSHTDAELKARLEKLNDRNLPPFARAVRTYARIDHPHPERAIRFALLAVRSICREVVLFHETWPRSKPMPDEELARELTRQFLSYLGVYSRSA
jgi:AcrR family transcriptional regulator